MPFLILPPAAPPFLDESIDRALCSRGLRSSPSPIRCTFAHPPLRAVRLSLPFWFSNLLECLSPHCFHPPYLMRTAAALLMHSNVPSQIREKAFPVENLLFPFLTSRNRAPHAVCIRLDPFTPSQISLLLNQTSHSLNLRLLHFSKYQPSSALP